MVACCVCLGSDNQLLMQLLPFHIHHSRSIRFFSFSFHPLLLFAWGVGGMVRARISDSGSDIDDHLPPYVPRPTTRGGTTTTSIILNVYRASWQKAHTYSSSTPLLSFFSLLPLFFFLFSLPACLVHRFHKEGEWAQQLYPTFEVHTHGFDVDGCI